MTLIWAKKIEWKRALFTDDAVTVWQKRISAAYNYRPKLREIQWDNYHLIIASCWSVKDIDLTINIIESKLATEELITTIWLSCAIQAALIEAMKTIKELWWDAQVQLLILETITDTLYASEEFALFEPTEQADLVFGSAEWAFHNLSEYKWFFDSFHTAILSDEYCAMPIYVYRDWEMFEFDEYDSAETMFEILSSNNNKDDWEKICSETASPNEWGNHREVYTLWSRSWLCTKKTTKLWQNPRTDDSETVKATETS